MGSSRTPFEWFVVALHRRLCLLRLAEWAGLGMAVGCGVAALLVPILVWRGEDAWRVAWAAPALGGLAGAIRGIARRPTALAAATEGDRQLSLDDLFATAWAIRGGGDASGAGDPWRRAVLAHASLRAADHRPADVMLHRFGLRAWGGIALALALVATLASFSSQPLRAAAASRGSSVGAPQPQLAEAARPIVQIVSSQPEPRRRLEQNPTEEAVPGDTRAGADAAETDSERQATPKAEPGGSPQASSAGSGDGAGRTNPTEPAGPDLDRPPGAGPDPESSTGPARAAGGVGRAAAADPRESGDGGGGGTVAQPVAGVAPPPWRHPAWGAAAESADRAVRVGRVPDEVRDLVREYFDRPAAPAPTSTPSR